MSKEPTGDTVHVAPLGATVLALLSFFALVLFVVGTPINWLSRVTMSTSVYYRLWNVRIDMGGDARTVANADQGCTSRREHFEVAEVFAILTIFVALVSVVLGVGGMWRRPLALAGGVAAGVTSVTSLAAWATGVRIYFKEMCEESSLEAQQYEIGPGLGLFVTGWVLVVLACIGVFVLSRNANRYSLVADGAMTRMGAILFAVAAFIGLGAATIATPIDVLFRHAGESTTRVSLWKVKTFVNGTMTREMSYGELDCGEMTRYAQYGEAFAIATIAAMLVALIAGIVAAVRTKSGLRWLIVTGVVATLCAVATVGAELVLYYRRFCTAMSLREQKFIIAPGAALMATALLVMFVATVLVIALAIARRLWHGEALGNMRWSAFVFLAGCVIALILGTVGASQTIFTKAAGNNYSRMRWWEEERLIGGVYEQLDFACTSLWKVMSAGGALNIGGAVATGAAVLLGAGQLSSRALRVPASGVAFLASVLFLVSWVLGLSGYYRDSCGWTPSDDGYRLATGFGLVVAACALTLIVGVVNLVVSPW